MNTIGSVNQIANYIKNNLSKGYTVDSLKWALINQGYSRSLITKAIEIVNKDMAEKAPKLIEKPAISYEAYDGDDSLVSKKPWWKRLFGLD